MSHPGMTRRRVKSLRFALIGVCTVAGILTYFQLLYKSPRVNSGIARFEAVFKAHKDIVTAVRFVPGDSLIVTSSVDGTIKIWQTRSAKVVQEIRHPGAISYLDLSADGKYIITGSYDSRVRLWNRMDGRLIKEFGGHKGTVWTVAFSADGSRIASGGDDAIIHVWDARTGQLLQKMIGHDRIIWSVKFSPDGTKLVSGSFDYTVKLWQVSDGKLVWDNRGHSETVVDVAFSHSGQLIASTSDDKTIKIWNVATRKLLQSMKVPEHVQAVAFSPDDQRLFTGGRDKPVIGEFLQNLFGDSKINKGVSARLFKVSTGKLLQTFSNHANDVMDVAFSHNGKMIASASADKTVEVWTVLK